jgi:hypothetical protein
MRNPTTLSFPGLSLSLKSGPQIGMSMVPCACVPGPNFNVATTFSVGYLPSFRCALTAIVTSVRDQSLQTSTAALKPALVRVAVVRFDSGPGPPRSILTVLGDFQPLYARASSRVLFRLAYTTVCAYDP